MILDEISEKLNHGHFVLLSLKHFLYDKDRDHVTAVMEFFNVKHLLFF